MKKNTKKGFTLIELLVVIAIIGILASVVLVNLNSARTKGSDAKIKTTLSNIRSAAELAADGNDYTGICADTDIVAMLTSVDADGTDNCDVSATGDKWAVVVDLPGVTDGTGVGFWCVDSAGAAKDVGALTAGDDETC